MSDELFKMYAEAGCPKGDIENDTVMDWAAETISALRKSREWIPAETPPESGLYIIIDTRTGKQACSGIWSKGSAVQMLKSFEARRLRGARPDITADDIKHLAVQRWPAPEQKVDIPDSQPLGNIPR